MLLVGVVLAAGAIVALAAITPADAQDTSTRILAGLQSAAERGDRRAQAALQDLSVFAARKGLDLSGISAESIGDLASVGRVKLRATGIAPFWIDVVQDVRFDAAYTIDNYVLERRAVALSLSSGDGYRGRLTMDGFRPIERLCELRDLSGAVIDDGDVDVWLGDSWVTRVGFGPERTDFWSGDCATITGRVRALLTQAHADDQLGERVSDARLTINSAALTVPAPGIVELLRQDDVLLFDPEADLLAPWSGLAAHVRLVAPFNVFMARITASVDSGQIKNPFIPLDITPPKEVAP